MRVLYVDDEPDIREIAVLALRLDSDFDVMTAASGREALSAAIDFRPDIILLDVMMPEMDGLATLARLREGDATSAIPVVFITARTQALEIERFLKLGALGVIPKPFDPLTLAMQVRALVPSSVEPGR
ncbi:response regulator [Methylopila turkensis]|uniref:Response regulator n=1 Tax=Methylopila turkensis TaxID=1437816 RepID=A0A9W6JNV2_9HYPH|nr:response regulator [Methylopila turkensis]GLK81060.1 response regulator [Methylopila turkensis]